jgi:uncharacterized protein (TIGR03437 family)
MLLKKSKILCLLLQIPLLGQSGGSCAFQIIAGPPSTSAGDGGQATAAWLFDPKALAFDKSGALFIADTRNNRIRKVGLNGIITTAAGNGTAGAGGDQGKATDAELSGPEGVLAAPDGKLYISDTGNHRIRVVTTDGVIHPFAGTGHPGFDGDGAAAVAAELNGPTGLTLDTQGALYFADTNNNRIRRIDSAGIISTVVGSGKGAPAIFDLGCCYGGDGGPATSARLDHPRGLAFDAKGNIFVADTGNNLVRRVGADEIITTAAGSLTLKSLASYPAPALDALLLTPSNIVVLADGSVLIPGLFDVLRLTPDGKTLQHYAGGPLGTAVAIDSLGRIYTAGVNDVVSRVSQAGAAAEIFAGQTHYGTGSEGGPALGAVLNRPVGIAVGSNGDVYVADRDNRRIVSISAKGTLHLLASVSDPEFIAVDPSGAVFVSDTVNRKILRIANGKVTTFAGGGFGSVQEIATSQDFAATSVDLTRPYGLVIRPNGNLYAFVQRPGAASGEIIRITPDGRLRTIYSLRSFGAFPEPLGVFRGLSIDADDNLLVAIGANSNAGFVIKLDPDGNPIPSAIIGPAGPVFDLATSIATGSSGSLFVVDKALRIKQLSSEGIFPTIYNRDRNEFLGYYPGSIFDVESASPMSIATDAKGNLFVADRDLHRIRMLPAGSCNPSEGPVVRGIAGSALGAAPDPTLFLLPYFAPGELISIYGSLLGPKDGAGPVLDEHGLVPKSLAGVRVLFDDIPGPVLFARTDQVNAIIPFTMYGRDQIRVQVERDGIISDASLINLVEAWPSLFSFFDPSVGPSENAVAVNEDGSVNSAANPARAGSFVTLYVSGMGRTHPEGQDGHLASVPLSAPRVPVTATTSSGDPIEVQYAGDAPGLVEGVMQINIRATASRITLKAGDLTVPFFISIK